MWKSLFSNSLRNPDLGLLVLRIVGGGMMLTHGWGKMMKVFAGDFAFADPLGIGAAPSLVLTVFAEVICAFFLIVGWKSKFFSLFLMFTMLVAAFVVHGADPLRDKELALVYFAIYLAIYFMGAGKISIDGSRGDS